MERGADDELGHMKMERQSLEGGPTFPQRRCIDRAVFEGYITSMAAISASRSD
jgi:hypothetical protein